MKIHGKENDLLDRVRKDSYFSPIVSELDSLLDPTTYIGRAPEQVAEFLQDEVKPVLALYDLEKIAQPVNLKI